MLNYIKEFIVSNIKDGVCLFCGSDVCEKVREMLKVVRESVINRYWIVAVWHGL